MANMAARKDVAAEGSSQRLSCKRKLVAPNGKSALQPTKASEKAPDEVATALRMDPKSTPRARMRDIVAKGYETHHPARLGGVNSYDKRAKCVHKVWEPPDLRVLPGMDGLPTIEIDFGEFVAKWATVKSRGAVHLQRVRDGTYERHFHAVGLQWRDLEHISQRVVDRSTRKLVVALFVDCVPDCVTATMRTHFGRLSQENALIEQNRLEHGKKPLPFSKPCCRGPARPCERFMVGYTVSCDRAQTVQSNSGGDGNESAGNNLLQVRGALVVFNQVLGHAAPEEYNATRAAIPSAFRFGGDETGITGLAGNVFCLETGVAGRLDKHWDNGDRPPCAIMPIGKWPKGTGRLLLWTIGLRVDAWMGDVTVFDSCDILHSVEPVPTNTRKKWHRSSLVAFGKCLLVAVASSAHSGDDSLASTWSLCTCNCAAKRDLGAPGLEPWPNSARYDARAARPFSQW